VTRRADDLWAIAAYFNPAGSRRRRENYRQFRRHLNLPLLAVEIAYGPDFELGDADADILIRLRGRDVLWQKERLINLALPALPPECSKIVWLDCDLVFAAADWPEAVRRRLDAVALLQPFSHAHLMPAGWVHGDAVPPDAEVRHPPAYLIAMGATPEAAVAFTSGDVVQMNYTPGMAWAARRALVEAHGLYDACIIGGGDGAIMRAAFGFPELTAKRQMMNAARQEHYLAWAEPFREAVGGGVSYVDGDVFHLWHGAPQNRRYTARHRDFAPFGFDPRTDIAMDDGGAWRWNSDKSDMHAFLSDYFRSRDEDG
jgi:hypothetical protein